MDSPNIKEIASRFSAIAQSFCDAVVAAERTEKNVFLLRSNDRRLEPLLANVRPNEQGGRPRCREPFG